MEGQDFFSLLKGGLLMYLTLQELFQFCALITGIVTLVYQLTKKK